MVRTNKHSPWNLTSLFCCNGHRTAIAPASPSRPLLLLYLLSLLLCCLCRPSPMSHAPNHGNKSRPTTPAASLLSFLPDKARALTSALPACDGEVLAYLSAFGRRDLPSGALDSPGRRRHWKPWRNSRRPNLLKLEAASDTRPSSPSSPSSSSSCGGSCSSPARHKPSFECDCFGCYCSYWSRWNDSPNRETIHKILDMLDVHLLQQKGQVTDQEGEGKQHQDSGSGKDCERRGKLWQKRGGKNKAAREPAAAGKEEEVRASALSDMASAGEEGTERVNDYCTGAGHEQASTKVNSSTENGGKKQQQQQRVPAGKRKSNQVIPINSAGLAVEMEEEGSGSREEKKEQSEEPAVQNMVVEAMAAAEAGGDGNSNPNPNANNANVRRGGRGGILGRVFPDALGGLASRLWDLVSLRTRSHTMDFY